MLTTTPRGLFKDFEALLYFGPYLFARQKVAGTKNAVRISDPPFLQNKKGAGMKDALANFGSFGTKNAVRISDPPSYNSVAKL